MNITNEHAEYLLNLPKKVIKDDILLSIFAINQSFPLHERIELVSEKDTEFIFLWEIRQSAKNTYYYYE
jgi:hypothetical protein